MMRIFVIFSLCVLCLCSCSHIVDGQEENTGRRVSIEDIQEVSEQQGEKRITTKDNTRQDLPIYYWTENGEVFHSDLTCSALSNSDKLNRGNITHAYSDGVQRSCSRCFGE